MIQFRPFYLALALCSFLLYSCSKQKKAKVDSNPVIQVVQPDTTLELPTFRNQFPQLLVKRNECDTVSATLEIRKLQVEVKVVGNIATTIFDITFYNDLERLLDGEFCFPLGEGQYVTYFAHETSEGLKEASVVEKTKGRVTYESIVRRRIDPALLEWTAGNNYRSRVYPIPAKGTKRIVIGFEQELLFAGNSYVYYQPFFLQKKIDEFSVKTQVFKNSSTPALYGKDPMTITFKQWKENWQAEEKFTQYLANKALSFAVPIDPAAPAVYYENKDGQTYFYTVVHPEIRMETKSKISSLTVFWDVSGSAENSDQKKLLEFLKHYCADNDYPQIKLVTFSMAVHEELDFHGGEQNWSKLENRINSLVYDGATQLACLDVQKYQSDELVLISDGLQNIGSKVMQKARKPMHVVAASPSVSFSYLKYLAITNNGLFVDLSTRSVAEASKFLLSRPFQFISSEFDSEEVGAVVPSIPSVVKDKFSVAGVMKGNSGVLKLNFGIGTKVLQSIEVPLRKVEADYSNMVPKMWAQKRISELDIFPEENEKKITEVAKSFEVVTRYTSLLILDGLEDYVEHRIEPKDKKWKQEYRKRISEIEKVKVEKQQENTERIANEFKEWKDWYDTNYEHRETSNAKGRMRSISVDVDELVIADSTASPIISYVAPVVSGTSTFFFNASTNSNVAGTSDGSILVNAWEAETPYMKALKETPKEKLYAKYLSMKSAYLSTPSFFVDVADYFVKQKEIPTAIRILSNLAELQLENHQLLRVLAKRLQQLNENALAISVYEKILQIREEEPQSYRDLGLAYERNKEYQKGFDMLLNVLKKDWDGRFPGIEVLVAVELNHLIDRAPRSLKTKALDTRLRKSMPVDMRIVINWDSDNCDMDLWVTDPYKEKCYYSSPLTEIGGKLSRDFTGGYGPEVFMIKKASKGKYVVEVDYFGTHSQSLSGPTTVQAELYTNYGTKKEKMEVITVRLSESKEVVKLADFEFK
jgi:hypothetical protein